MKPILYTFRRCPYAIRARLAIEISGVEVDLREVDLRNKPQALLDCSPKGTVPVLQLADGTVIDESLDIMRWALAINDPQRWMNDANREAETETRRLIDENDGSFKIQLDRYKYPNRHPGHTAEIYRDEAGKFLQVLCLRLVRHGYLMGERQSLADAAIFPFVRQFAHVDREWFYATYDGALASWLDRHLNSPLFLSVMQAESKLPAVAALE